jgi:hypothetical protein
MTARKLSIHLISVALLLTWGAVLLYFHISGRIVNYLPPVTEGWFRPMALAGGIGLILLGIFNLATLGSEEADECCEHEHNHDDHHHDHTHELKHDDHSCCGHDHGHHDHHHAHSHEHADDHAHGILEETGALGRTGAIAILALPILVAATFTPDKFSGAAATKKGLYNPNYSDTSRADQFSLRKDAPSSAPLTPSVSSTPAGGRVPGSAAPAAAAKATTTAAPTPSKGAQSYGTFTLEDLKQQVPMSKEGHFILEVPELFYTAGDLEVQKVLAGQTVTTTAQVMPEKVNNPDGKRLRILRLLVQCCAADARPFSVPVEFEQKAPEFKEMSWVKVVGTVEYRQEGGQTVPIVRAAKMEETTEPDQSMLY